MATDPCHAPSLSTPPIFDIFQAIAGRHLNVMLRSGEAYKDFIYKAHSQGWLLGDYDGTPVLINLSSTESIEVLPDR